MIDHFTLLDEPRRPWLDADSLRQKFLARSAEVHPDRVHQAPPAEKREATARYTALNAAYQCLRESRDRLAHLLELEHGARPAVIQNVPQDLMDAFFDVGRLLKEADEFLEEKSRVTSPLLKVPLFAKGQEVSDRLQAARQALASRQADLEKQIQALDEVWSRAPDTATKAPLLERLEEIHRLLSYFMRWNAQLQERIVRIML